MVMLTLLVVRQFVVLLLVVLLLLQVVPLLGILMVKGLLKSYLLLLNGPRDLSVLSCFLAHARMSKWSLLFLALLMRVVGGAGTCHLGSRESIHLLR